jgi:hypothetical protein
MSFTETATAVFAIAAVSVFILVNLIFGYSLYLYTFVALIGFLFAVFYPRAGVYAIVFLTFVFERFFTLVPIFWNRAEYKIYPLDILFVGVIAGTILAGVRHLQNVRFKIVDWLVAIFILASAAYFFVSAYFLHADPSIAFSTFKNYAFYGLFYFVILFLFQSEKDLFQLMKFMLAGAAAITIFIFIGILRGEGLWTAFTPLSTPGTRILAFPHAFYLTMAVLVSLAWIALKKSKTNNFLYILIPVWMVGIVGSLMRHLWISLFVSAIILFWLLPLEKRRALKKIFFRYAFWTAILLAFLAYVSFLFPTSSVSKTFSSAVGVAGKRFASTAQVSSDESLNWRRNVWQSAWTEFKKTPLLGIGYGKKLSVEIGAKYRDFVEVRNIHNSLLTIFIQMGLWSVVLFGAMFWLLAKPAFEKIKRAKDNLEGGQLLLLAVFLTLFANYLIAFLFQTYLETNLLGMFFWIITGALRITYEYTNK